MTDPVFVFGSNLAGRHGKGAAEWAKLHRGAIYGQGEGLQGNSYAIPVKDGRAGARLTCPSQTLRLSQIMTHVQTFVEFAKSRPDLRFQVTPVGCGLAGYEPGQIAPMFRGSPSNVILPPEFTKVIQQIEGGR